MDPNQQPAQDPGQPQPASPPPPGNQPLQPVPDHPEKMEYDPNYLDNIAPGASQQKFLSGTFGKIFWVLIGIFVLAVSLIIAFSGKDDTADLQRMFVRLEEYQTVVKDIHPDIRSGNLKDINSQLKTWMLSSKNEAEELLTLGEVKKTDFSKTMKQEEAGAADELVEKFENARLSANLNTVYSNTMSYEINEMLILYKQMSKSKSSQIREYAAETSKTLGDIKEKFDNYSDDGN